MKKKILTFILLTGGLILPLLFIYLINVLHVRKVIVISSYPSLSGLEAVGGSNIIFLDAKKVTSGLLKKNSYAKNISILKIYPNTLKITVDSRTPIAMVRINGKLFLVDPDGYIIGESENQQVPFIDGIQLKGNQTGRVDWTVIKALNILDDLTKQSISIDRLMMDTDNSLMTLTLAGDIPVIIPLNVDINRTATSLQAIINRFRIEGKSVTKIDFRYDKPIAIIQNEEKNSSSQ